VRRRNGRMEEWKEGKERKGEQKSAPPPPLHKLVERGAGGVRPQFAIEESESH